MNEFPGLTSVILHISGIFLIWLTAIIVVYLVKKNAVGVYVPENVKAEIRRGARITYLFLHTLAFGAVLLIGLFLANPFERRYTDTNAATVSEVDPNFVAPTNEEITLSNETSTTAQKAEQNKEKATKENTQALKDATELFQKAADAAESTTNSH